MDGIEMQLKYVIVFMTACTKTHAGLDSRSVTQIIGYLPDPESLAHPYVDITSRFLYAYFHATILFLPARELIEPDGYSRPKPILVEHL